MGRLPVSLRVREHLVVTGIVQGVGFRPFVYRLASELGLTGEVGNTATEVFIDVDGPPDRLDDFARRLRDEAPPLARVDGVVRDRSPAPRRTGSTAFRIVDSRVGSGERTIVPPDSSVCDACIDELRDPTNRRFGHPFITCTDCGPRFTIITALPYDRPNTTMHEFEMCSACREEYTDPADRRYHAQPIACPVCGPRLALLDSAGNAVTGDPIAQAVEALRAGQIVAIKGLGGFHLACDATSHWSVVELRNRKHRPDKPFAVMVASMAQARSVACLGDAEAGELQSPASPIVLARAQRRSAVAEPVAPGNPLIGVMLPSTPVHHLLFDAGAGPLVMTSGNLAGEPIVHGDEDAVTKLGPLVDRILTHDRPIAVPCDDSVVRVVGGRLLPIRRARGYAPVPVTLPAAGHPVLAVGGELKNTFCLTTGRQAWISQHIGDMENLETIRAFEQSVERFERFFAIRPTSVAVDAHPGYASGRWARQRDSRQSGVTSVQHHWAHVAAVMAEHGLEPDTEVVGVAFDGTGYGSDGTVWGGEILLADARSFRRAGWLRPVPLPGGDGAVRYPSRMALSYLWATGLTWDPSIPAVAETAADEQRLLRIQLERNVECVLSSSMGRLFDAVASLLGVRHEITYEAQAAIELEILATAGVAEHRTYRFGWDGQVLDPAPVLRGVVEDLDAGASVEAIAAGFHLAVAGAVARVVEAVAPDSSQPAVLSGGCFQNALLLDLCQERLGRTGRPVLTHHIVPPNDGGLALGQAYIVATQPIGT